MGDEKEDRPLSFEEVLAEEIQALRGVDPIQSVEDADPHNLVGLAFSGGGIRSATFNLGVLQGLAKLGLLDRFDYLSTVSGGGYIGTWLQAWLHRTREKKEEPPLQIIQQALSSAAEPREIRFLREYSNYLTPRVGLLSGDTWTLVSIYLRNLLLNLVVTVMAIASALLMLHAFDHAFQLLAYHPRWALGTAASAIIVAIIAATLNLVSDFRKDLKPYFIARRSGVLFLVIGPILLSTYAVSAYGWSHYHNLVRLNLAPGVWRGWSTFMLVYLLGSMIPAFVRWEVKRRSDRWREAIKPGDVAWVLIATLLGAGIAAAFFYAFGRAIESLGTSTYVGRFGPIAGPLVLSLGIGTVMAMHVGIAGNALSEQLREWQARLVGVLIGSAVLLTLGRLIASVRYEEIVGCGTVAVPAWLGSTIASAWAGRPDSGPVSAVTSAIRSIVLRVGPYIFVIGLVVGIAILANLVVDQIPCTRTMTQMLVTIGLSFLCLAVSAVLSLRFGINDFSIGSLYRNRLVRCYLGAIRSDQREVNLFIGFSEEDDLRSLSDLDAAVATKPVKSRLEQLYDRVRATLGGEAKATAEPAASDSSDEDYLQRTAARASKPAGPEDCRPYPIYNATLNLVGGDKLAWQRRRARPFVFTPKHCGFALSPWDTDFDPAVQAFRPASKYAAGISLGTAMSISGAAVSPSMGDRTTPALAFLLTVFNLRLGQWLPNPRHPEIWQRRGPRFGLGLLVKELLGMTNEEQRYVYLSDGGHFENLGIFELIRRRCRFIVAVDAGEDAKREFADLGNAIERVRTDLGYEIEIDVEPLELDPGTSRSRARCAVGVIDYGSTTGVLVYVKATLTGSEATDVVRYAKQRPAFPHESTADQWFDETQFESYRRLGQHTANEIFGALGDRQELARLTTDKLFLGLHQRWRPRADADERFIRHTEDLNRIARSVRDDPRLGFMALQLFPELWDLETSTGAPLDRGDFGLPASGEALRCGFYVAHEMIQLMENVYLDLDLETQLDHPDNRGWMNLFRRWAWSSMFRASWAISASTFGARFQAFAERRYGLGTSEIVVRDPLASTALDLGDEEIESKTGLNFFEVELLRLFRELHKERGFSVLALAFPVALPAAAISGRDQHLMMNCAFAVVGGERRLFYFRVQDHLRKMGVARRALEQLLLTETITADPELATFGVDVPDDLRERAQRLGDEAVDAGRLEEFRRMFDSVVRDVRSRRPS